jgi:hypothetical protein
VTAIGLTAVFGGRATSVDAAGSTAKPDIHSCFVWSTGGAYTGQPTQLQYWTGSVWKTNRTANTNSNGCVRFDDITPGYYYRIVAHVVFRYSSSCYDVWSGPSNYIWSLPGDAPNRLGTYNVFFQGRFGC